MLPVLYSLIYCVTTLIDMPAGLCAARRQATHRQMVGPVMMNPVLRQIKPFLMSLFNLAERIKKIAIFFVFCFNIASKRKNNFLSSEFLTGFLLMILNIYWLIYLVIF